MKKISLLSFIITLLICFSAYAADIEIVSSVNVSGNPNIATDYILNVVSTKPGQTLSRDMILNDINEIYNQGFFSFVDVNYSNEELGTAVTFVVQENPMIESINFSGNTLYTTEQLMNLVFSSPGTVFNRRFFRNDL
ncbi:MAG: outer membrane protein assembly factor, partial [Synergistaceae bacterium]|nr:outer membrane protein assembly factor [Synergistaceae bacterium]